MITLQEIMDNLTYGELSHVSVGGAALGFIEDKDYPKIVSCLNGALTALHKRFLLRTGEISLQQQEGLVTYYLRPEYTVSAGTLGNTKYIIDSLADPFTGNLFKIEQVLNADGAVLTLNDAAVSEDRPVYYNGAIIQQSPIYTPNYDTLVMVPTPELIKIKYRADHPRIRITSGFEPTAIQIHIPTHILDAISLNIAARIYSPLTVGDGQTSASSSFMYQYEMECKRLESEGMTLDDNSYDTRFDDSGWV